MFFNKKSSAPQEKLYRIVVHISVLFNANIRNVTLWNSAITLRTLAPAVARNARSEFERIYLLCTHTHTHTLPIIHMKCKLFQRCPTLIGYDFKVTQYVLTQLIRKYSTVVKYTHHIQCYSSAERLLRLLITTPSTCLDLRSRVVKSNCILS